MIRAGLTALLIPLAISMASAQRFPDHDAGYFACAVADSIRAPEFPTSWPPRLHEVAAVMEELGDSLWVSVSANGRLISATFSPRNHEPEWFESIACRVAAIPGVLSVACLPPLDPATAPVFVRGARGAVDPPESVEACYIPRGPCPESHISIDVVFDTDGHLLEPIILDVDEECTQHVLEWIQACRWTPAHRENGNVPMAGTISIPLE
ncbi:MAG: hypothetical protein R3E97_11405 [Candidatus Eisenbacteria bacterium]